MAENVGAVNHAAHDRGLIIGAALTSVVLWSSAFVAIRFAGRELGPGPLALGRLIVASVALGGAMLAHGNALPPRRALAGAVGCGVLWFGVYNVALNAAERRVDAGTASLLVNTGPIFIAIVAGVWLREGFPRWLLAGCAVSFSGVALIGLGVAVLMGWVLLGETPALLALPGGALCLAGVGLTRRRPPVREEARRARPRGRSFDFGTSSSRGDPTEGTGEGDGTLAQDRNCGGGIRCCTAGARHLACCEPDFLLHRPDLAALHGARRRQQADDRRGGWAGRGGYAREYRHSRKRRRGHRRGQTGHARRHLHRCFLAVYSGDSNYNSSRDGSSGECFTVGKAAAALSSRPQSATSTLAGSDRDLVTVTGVPGPVPPAAWPSRSVDP